ncbi:MAG: PQQ-binding-like beta-propeller repeat protein [Spirochaetes bacterium]|nr:PQQ-binding-like beta-propeller repeat protein [Spirochaetota bacterium]
MLKHAFILAAAALSVFAAAPASDSRTRAMNYWPQWRGPDVNGTAPLAEPPVQWNEKKNIRWKLAIPGKGHATPVIWENTIVVLTAVPLEKDAKTLRFVVIAVDRERGTVLWEKTMCEVKPHEGAHPDGSFASASAMIDGERIYAHFGSRGIYCLDMKGKLLWKKDLGRMKIARGFGEGSSPAMSEKAVFIVWDNETPSFIAALDKKTGSEIWRTPRDEKTSWSTPVVIRHGGKEIVITSATKRMRAYDADKGSLIWEAGGMTLSTIPSPVYDEARLYAMSGFLGSALIAIPLDVKGEVAEKQFAWKYSQDASYVPSALLYNGSIYFIKFTEGALSSLDAKTGKVRYAKEKIPGLKGVYSSPVAAAGRVYVTGRNGVTAVISDTAPFKILATNTLDDQFSASAAVVGKEIILRGHRSLYSIMGR